MALEAQACTFAGGPLTLSSASFCLACTLATITARRLGVLSTVTCPWASCSFFSSCGTACLHVPTMHLVCAHMPAAMLLPCNKLCGVLLAELPLHRQLGEQPMLHVVGAQPSGITIT